MPDSTTTPVIAVDTTTLTYHHRPRTADDAALRYLITLDHPGLWAHTLHGHWLREAVTNRHARLLLTHHHTPFLAEALRSVLDLPAAGLHNITGTPHERLSRRIDTDHPTGAALILTSFLDAHTAGWAWTRDQSQPTELLIPRLDRAGQRTLRRGDIVAIHQFLDQLLHHGHGTVRPRRPLLEVPLTNRNGTLEAGIAGACRALRHHGYHADADELDARLDTCRSREHALRILGDYVTDGGPDTDPHGTPH
jgi:hypothetical protein